MFFQWFALNMLVLWYFKGIKFRGFRGFRKNGENLQQAIRQIKSSRKKIEKYIFFKTNLYTVFIR